MHDVPTKVAAEMEQLRKQTAARSSEPVEVYSAAKNGGSPAKRARVSCRFENSMGAQSTAACSSLLAERDEFKSRYEALLHEIQGISGLTEKAKELRAKVADV